MKKELQLSKSNRVLNNAPVLLVTTWNKELEKANITTVAWTMPVKHDPPTISISINPRSYSHQLVNACGEFVINVPTADYLNQVYTIGTTSGRDFDKVKETGLSFVDSQMVLPPTIAECVAHLECKVLFNLGRDGFARSYPWIFIAEVLRFTADESVFVDEHWNLGKITLIHHLGSNRFELSTGETVTVD